MFLDINMEKRLFSILPNMMQLTNWLLLQILGICFAQNLRADIYAQKAKWNWRLAPAAV